MDDFTTAFLFIDNANQLLDYHQRSTQSFLLLAAIGIVLLICIGIFSAIRKKSQASNLIVVGIVLTGIGLGSARSHFEDYKEVAQDYGRLLEIYGNHQYKTAEGVIHVLHTQPYGGMIEEILLKLVILHLKLVTLWSR